MGIEARPAQVNALERYGDWEGDTLIGRGQQGAILILVERKPLLLCVHRLSSRHAMGVAQAVIGALSALMARWVKTITLDNRSEFTPHKRMAQALEADIWLAHPCAAYEQARNENTSGLLCQYVPKSISFNELTHPQSQAYITELNYRSRKNRLPNTLRSFPRTPCCT